MAGDGSAQNAQLHFAGQLDERGRLQAALAKAIADREAAHDAGLTGIAAAKAQIVQLRAELVAARKWRTEHEAKLAMEAAMDEGAPVEEDEEAETEESKDESYTSIGSSSPPPEEAMTSRSGGTAPAAAPEGNAPVVVGHHRRATDMDSAADQNQAAAQAEAPAAPAAPPRKPGSSRDIEDARARGQALKLEIRGLQHELARWKHQVELQDHTRPKQEEEIVRLKAELTHAHDVLESTRHAVLHHEVDRQAAMQQAALLVRTPPPMGDAVDAQAREPPPMVPATSRSHGNIEAKAERIVREQAEARNVELSAKAKHLTGVVAAQQLLIQRLEKQVLMEQRRLEQKNEELFLASTSMAQLKGVLRKRSDRMVESVLGVGGPPPLVATKHRAASLPPGFSSEGSANSMQPPRLPPI